jgi:hypothetical protein
MPVRYFTDNGKRNNGFTKTDLIGEQNPILLLFFKIFRRSVAPSLLENPLASSYHPLCDFLKRLVHCHKIAYNIVTQLAHQVIKVKQAGGVIHSAA